ncbi:MAG TPA: hypothetical protein DIW17_01815 [Clostridiales bacterium]|nr:hypothetical protein [Clostridiales bacterium]
MKKYLNGLVKVIDKVYGYGILACLFGGGLTFFGYLAAIFIGGESATNICVFIYKTVFPILIYASTVLVLLGLLKMYLSGDVALSIAKSPKK